MATIRVLVADPHYLVGDALGQALGRDPDLSVLGQRPTVGIETIEAVVKFRPDVAVLDYWLPDMHGPPVIRSILEWAPDQRILVLSAVSGPEQVSACLQAGAVGFLPKSVPLSLLAEAVHRAHAGEKPVLKELLGQMVAEMSRRHMEPEVHVSALLSLTPRELAVLSDLSHGLSVREIASRLAVPVGTVRSRVHRILRKTGTRSQLEAVAIARKERLIQDQ